MLLRRSQTVYSVLETWRTLTQIHFILGAYEHYDWKGWKVCQGLRALNALQSPARMPDSLQLPAPQVARDLTSSSDTPKAPVHSYTETHTQINLKQTKTPIMSQFACLVFCLVNFLLRVCVCVLGMCRSKNSSQKLVLCCPLVDPISNTVWPQTPWPTEKFCQPPWIFLFATTYGHQYVEWYLTHNGHLHKIYCMN